MSKSKETPKDVDVFEPQDSKPEVTNTSHVDENKEEKKQKKELVYVHEPGTVHLSAYEATVAEAEQKVAVAKDELEAAKRALDEKKAASRFEEQ